MTQAHGAYSKDRRMTISASDEDDDRSIYARIKNTIMVGNSASDSDAAEVIFSRSSSSNIATTTANDSGKGNNSVDNGNRNNEDGQDDGEDDNDIQKTCNYDFHLIDYDGIDGDDDVDCEDDDVGETTKGYGDDGFSGGFDPDKVKLIQEIIDQKIRKFVDSDEFISVAKSVRRQRQTESSALTSAISQSSVSSKSDDNVDVNLPESWNHDQLKIGKLITSGGFSDVHRVKLRSFSCRVNDYNDLRQQQQQQQHPSGIRNHQRRKIVVKTVKEDLLSNDVQFTLAAIDLVKEALLMSVLDHPYVLKPVAVSAMGMKAYQLSNGRPDAFFVAVPELDTTLSRQIKHWRPIHVPLVKTVIKKVVTNTEPNILERLDLASQLADAMTYLHSHGILHRDLKPQNVGLVANDDEDDAGNDMKKTLSSSKVQLFDFGRACCLDMTNRNPYEDTYHLTAKAGSRRYSSPESYIDLPYNLKSDVYSFALVLYHMVTLKRPFDDMDAHNHEFYVFQRGVRPSLDDSAIEPFPGLADIISKSWSQDPKARPTMQSISDQLKLLLSK